MIPKQLDENRFAQKLKLKIVRWYNLYGTRRALGDACQWLSLVFFLVECCSSRIPGHAPSPLTTASGLSCPRTGFHSGTQIHKQDCFG